MGGPGPNNRPVYALGQTERISVKSAGDEGMETMRTAIDLRSEDDAKNRLITALMVLDERIHSDQTNGSADPSLEVVRILLRGALDLL